MIAVAVYLVLSMLILGAGVLLLAIERPHRPIR